MRRKRSRGRRWGSIWKRCRLPGGDPRQAHPAHSDFQNPTERRAAGVAAQGIGAGGPSVPWWKNHIYARLHSARGTQSLRLSARPLWHAKNKPQKSHTFMGRKVLRAASNVGTSKGVSRSRNRARIYSARMASSMTTDPARCTKNLMPREAPVATPNADRTYMGTHHFQEHVHRKKREKRKLQSSRSAAQIMYNSLDAGESRSQSIEYAISPRNVVSRRAAGCMPSIPRWYFAPIEGSSAASSKGEAAHSGLNSKAAGSKP